MGKPADVVMNSVYVLCIYITNIEVVHVGDSMYVPLEIDKELVT